VSRHRRPGNCGRPAAEPILGLKQVHRKIGRHQALKLACVCSCAKESQPDTALALENDMDGAPGARCKIVH
jgi:hypothetical protein